MTNRSEKGTLDFYKFSVTFLFTKYAESGIVEVYRKLILHCIMVY